MIMLRFRRQIELSLLVLVLVTHAGHGQALRFSERVFPTTLAPAGYGHGGTFGLFTRNGQPSLFVMIYAAPNNLFEYTGGGVFRDIAEAAGVKFGTDHDRGMASADFDNDGDLDIYIAAGYTGNELWRNNGNDTFSDYTTDSNTFLNGQGQGVAWGDFDNDGWLDLFVAQTDGNNRLYINNRGGSFAEDSGTLSSQGASVQPVAFDVNGDGRLDLLVTREPGKSNLLYINRGDGKFEEQANRWGVEYATANGQGAGVGDYDRDGDLDVLFCDFAGSNLLWRNVGGRFEEVGAAAGIRIGGTRNRGALFGDFNDDGWPDIYVTRTGANRLFQNNGNGTFTDVAAAAGAAGNLDAYTPSMADYDNDGDLDIFFTNTGQPTLLLTNLGSPNNRLDFRLRGTQSNANGIGAVLTAWSNGRPQAQAIISGQGYVGTGSDLSAHFGLGRNKVLDSLVVKWPSGMIDRYYHLAANQKLLLVEGKTPVDRTAPSISNVTADEITSSAATIRWTTDEMADSQVEYGLTTSYGASTPLDLTLVNAHAATLSNLAANTRYHYRVLSWDAAGNWAISNDFTFTTAPDTQAPTLSNMATTAITAISAQIQWDADEPSDGRVEYGPDSTALSNSVLDTSFVTSHAVNLANLQPYTKYYFVISARDRAGNSRAGAKQSFKTLPAVAGLTRVSGDAQSGRAGELLPLPLVVRVINSAGEAVANAVAEFRVVAGGGRVSGESNCDSSVCTATTNASGLASIKWRLGKADSQKVQVRLSETRELTTVFTATLMPPTGIETRLVTRPTALALRNYPNPFRDFTQFEIDLPNAGWVSLKIYDLQGREVAALAEGALRAGQHLLIWRTPTAANGLGASGVYFAELRYHSDAPVSVAPQIQKRQKLFYLK